VAAAALLDRSAAAYSVASEVEAVDIRANTAHFVSMIEVVP